jgi:2'-5' RNA ligase
LFPNGETDLVENFRRVWDPLSRAVPAHITVAYPFEDEDDASELKTRLERVAANLEPFRVQLADPVVMDKEYLFLMVRQGGEQVRSLHERVYDDVLRLPRPGRFVPHMTVGRQEDADRIVQAQRSARDQGLALAGDINSVSVYRIGADSRVREFDIALGKNR